MNLTEVEMSESEDKAKQDAQSQANAVLAIYMVSELLGVTFDDAASIYLKSMQALTKAMASQSKQH